MRYFDEIHEQWFLTLEFDNSFVFTILMLDDEMRLTKCVSNTL